MTLASDDPRVSPALVQAGPGLIDGLARRAAGALLGTLRHGRLRLRLPDGATVSYGDDEETAEAPAATLEVLDWRFFRRMVAGGDVGLGEAYTAGLWASDDLVALFRLLLANLAELDRPRGPARLTGFANRLLHAARDNRRDRARRNIHAHYDLGNDFYRLFLDPSMTYSSAVFEHPGQGLEAAQRAKIERLLRPLELAPASHLLEIGCGWGSCALLAAREYGCRVTGITLSLAQADWARAAVAAAGLAERITIEIRDYRDLPATATYDAVVSIEMLEAVGHRHLPAYFTACDRALRPGGRLALQSITLPDQRYEAYRRRPDWIQKHIFPGGHLPSLGAIAGALRPTALTVRQALDIGPHYATTLRHWRERFLGALEPVRGLGFDDAFIRTWEYYLAYCEAGFAGGATQNFQLLFGKAS